jgi:hypothetical protein
MYDMGLIQPSRRDGSNPKPLVPALKHRAIVGMSLRDNHRVEVWRKATPHLHVERSGVEGRGHIFTFHK